MSTQKLPMVSFSLLGNAANEGDGDRDADCRRYEVVVREPGHLREVAHGRLAAIGLPVGVGGERGGGVEGQIGRHCRECLRVPGQAGLEAFDQVQHQHRDDAEKQHGDRVLGPAHIARLVDTCQPVEQPLQRPHHGIEQGALAGEHARHEHAKHRRHEKHEEQKEKDLQPAVGCHVRTSPASASLAPDRPAWRHRRRGR